MTRQAETIHRFRAMASPVTVRVIDPVEGAAVAAREVEAVFQDIERACSRFDPESDLMRANARPGDWTTVAPSCFEAIELAYAAYTRTGGAFDPRVLRTLTAMGYDRSLDFMSGSVRTEAAELPQPCAAQTWLPEFDAAGSRVRLGADPIDLGGIGKGYAVRRGIQTVAGLGSSALVEAGGDLATYGVGPARAAGEFRAWRAAVEDPRGDAIGADRQGRPIAILDASDAAVATSSISLRHWKSGDRAVHHLIDPRTGQPAAPGLLSVTVVDDDPAWAEVWTKAAFLQGARGIADFVDESGVAALWVDADGLLNHSAALGGRIIWEASDAR